MQFKHRLTTSKIFFVLFLICPLTYATYHNLDETLNTTYTLLYSLSHSIAGLKLWSTEPWVLYTFSEALEGKTIFKRIYLFHWVEICTDGTKEMVCKTASPLTQTKMHFGILPFGKIKTAMYFCLWCLLISENFYLYQKGKNCPILFCFVSFKFSVTMGLFWFVCYLHAFVSVFGLGNSLQKQYIRVNFWPPPAHLD